VGSHIYGLSSYNSDWGWPLVLPTPFDFSDIEKYYLFFEYVNEYDNTLLETIIDFENQKTTISPISSNLFETITQNMFLSELYESLFFS
jgi:hypothetical protein